MLGNKETIEQKDPLNLLIEEINSTIFSKEKWIDNEFYKIPEMTYSYKKVWKNDEHIINKTLFSDLWWLDIKQFELEDDNWKEKLINRTWDNVENQILEKISSIESYLEKFIKIDSGNDEVLNARKEIIVWWLEENITFLNIALEWLEFEKEKAILWIYFKWNTEEKKKSGFYINPEKRKEKLEKIEKLNTVVFWEKISNNPEYVEWNLDYLYENFEDYKKEVKKGKIEKKRLLSNDEEKRYNSYIAKLQSLSPEYQPKIRKKPKSVIDKKWKEVNIDIGDVKDNLNNNLIATDIQTWYMPHRAYFDKNVSGFTDTAKWLWVPHNKELKTKTAFDTIRLMWHENEQHWVSLVSHEILVWNIRWKQNLEVVEWTAMLWEELFEYWENMYTDWVDKNWKKVKIIDLEKISYVQNFPKTIMEEILTDEEFFDFLELQHKIEPDTTDPINRYLRFKRTGFQRKDITYTTWKLKAAQYINDVITWEKEWNFSDLYLWKVWFDDLDNIKILKNNLDEKNKELTDDKKIKLPENLFFSEAALFGVTQKEKWEDINSDLFFKYLEKKYPSFDFSKEKIDSISFWFKKQLLWTINTITTAIDTHERKNKWHISSRQVKKARKKVSIKTNKILNRWEKSLKKAA